MDGIENLNVSLTYTDTLAAGIMAHTEGEADPDSEWFPLFRIYAVLCLAKGEEVNAEDVHDAWSAWASQYRPGHKSNIPFGDLDEEVKRLDEPYVEAIRWFATAPESP